MIGRSTFIEQLLDGFKLPSTDDGWAETLYLKSLLSRLQRSVLGIDVLPNVDRAFQYPDNRHLGPRLAGACEHHLLVQKLGDFLAAFAADTLAEYPLDDGGGFRVWFESLTA